jgi:hypothetical protein
MATRGARVVPAEPALSLQADLLLLTVDPARGGLFPRRRRRFRKALAAAHRHDKGGSARRRPWHGVVARRQATTELAAGGLIERRDRRIHLRDRRAASERFHRLRRCLATNDFPEPRDRQLALLLAWSGVLRAPTRDERRIAARRLRELVRDELEGVRRAPLSGEAPTPAWVGSIGKVADQAQENFLADALIDFISGDLGGLEGWTGDAGGQSWGASGGESGDGR